MSSAMFYRIPEGTQPSTLLVERLHQHPVKTGHSTRQLRCYTAHTPGRHSVETYIADAFREQYAAHIDHFLPVLLTIESDGEIEAALGIRFGEGEPLFVEHYLDQSINNELNQRGFATSAIVEIGNLVSTRAGCSQLLFILLAELLDALGRDTGVFTATAQVQQLLGKIGCELTVLCAADGRRLGTHLTQWGSYYETSPCVIASNVSDTAQRLRERPVLARIFKHYSNDLARVIAMLAPETPLAMPA